MRERSIRSWRVCAISSTQRSTAESIPSPSRSILRKPASPQESLSHWMICRPSIAAGMTGQTAIGGIAVVKAAEKVVAKAKTIAAHMLEASEDDIEFANGTFSVKGTDQSKSIGDIALAVFAAHDLPDGVEASLDSDATYDPENFSFPHGTHLCAAEVDTETGKVTLRSYVCVDDVGVVVNPLIVDGQVHGGLAQGIAQALYEDAMYTEDGQLTAGTLVDYL